LIFIRNRDELAASKNGIGKSRHEGAIRSLPDPPGDAPDGWETIAWLDAAPTLESKEYRPATAIRGRAGFGSHRCNGRPS
jgi:hypothetical protein